MLPVVTRAAVAGARGLPALMASAKNTAQLIFSRNPSAVTAASKRTGITAVPGKIIEGMKNNKMMTALVLMDLGPEASELLSEMAAADAEVAELTARYGGVIDPVAEGTTANLASQVDEMRDIAAAANFLGGLDHLHTLRRVLKMPEEQFVLFDQLKVMREAIR